MFHVFFCAMEHNQAYTFESQSYTDLPQSIVNIPSDLDTPLATLCEGSFDKSFKSSGTSTTLELIFWRLTVKFTLYTAWNELFFLHKLQTQAMFVFFYLHMSRFNKISSNIS